MVIAQEVEIVTTCLGFCPQQLKDWEVAAKAFIRALWRSEVEERGSRVLGYSRSLRSTWVTRDLVSRWRPLGGW